MTFSLKYFNCLIPWRGKDTRVDAYIIPARKTPHVSADSPRFMEPGFPARVFVFELLDDDQGFVIGADREEAERLILEAWKVDQSAERMIEEGVLA